MGMFSDSWDELDNQLDSIAIELKIKINRNLPVSHKLAALAQAAKLELEQLRNKIEMQRENAELAKELSNLQKTEIIRLRQAIDKEDYVNEMFARDETIVRFHKALKAIAEHEHCKGDHTTGLSGHSSGHLCAAQIANAALKGDK